MNIMQSPNQWEHNIKGNPPPAGVEVELLCSWYGGEFVMLGTRVDYKPGSSKKQLKIGFRFMANGERIKERPEAWRFKKSR